MIVDITKLKEAILQCMREINDAAYDLRLEGCQVLLPENVKFSVQMVTGTDINAVERNQVATDANGTQTATTTQLSADSTVTNKVSSEIGESLRVGGSTSETTTISHPTVTSRGSGADVSEEVVEYEHETI